MELNPHDWHKRPRDCGKNDACTICRCPPQGTRKSTTSHRATLETENFPFRFIAREQSSQGWKHRGISPTNPARAKEPARPEAISIDASDPGDTMLSLMGRAAMLYVTGMKFPEIQKVMKLEQRVVARWKREWVEHWQAACRAAETQIVKMVRAQIGTKAILDDVDEYLKLAKTADRIATILPAPTKPTLLSFFESYVLPTCFYDDKERTIGTYRNALRLWRLITGDPPIEEITAETLTFFRDALSKRRGIRTCRKAATNTVASRLKSIQTLLDKAGPAGRRNRDAKSLIVSVPWIRPPRLEMKLPRVIAPEMFEAVYVATAGMDWPNIPGVRAPAWWKALLVMAYNTQLRRRTLFEMRMDEIDWQAGYLLLPANRFKGGRPMMVHLNPPAMEALQQIRAPRELVFPVTARMTLPQNLKTFYSWFHRLQNSAGIPEGEHFGLHEIRKTAATVLAGFSPQAAQLALGHKSLTTTMNSYINPTSIIGEALDAMPQPFGATVVSP
jgi:integrase